MKVSVNKIIAEIAKQSILLSGFIVPEGLEESLRQLYYDMVGRVGPEGHDWKSAQELNDHLRVKIKEVMMTTLHWNLEARYVAMCSVEKGIIWGIDLESLLNAVMYALQREKK